jgi:hypothetical protein
VNVREVAFLEISTSFNRSAVLFFLLSLNISLQIFDLERDIETFLILEKKGYLFVPKVFSNCKNIENCRGGF